MKCDSCDYSKAKKYFEASTEKEEGMKKVSLCAKCFSEVFLATPPYFRSWHSNHMLKVPVMEHYIAASVIAFLKTHQFQISKIIDTQYKGQTPFYMSVNVTTFDTEIGYKDGENYVHVKNTYLSKLILLWKEVHKSLELSLNLAFNNYDRAAVAELRFIFEKYLDFAYLLLPSTISKRSNEITFSDWIANKKFKSSMKQRCDQFNRSLSYKPYELYGYLCKGSHGSRAFLSTQDLVLSGFDDPYIFFKFSRWFSLFIWILELVHDINHIFSKDFKIENNDFDTLQTLYESFVLKYKIQLEEIKANQFFITEYYKHDVTYWTDFDMLVRFRCKGNCEKGLHKKLQDDYASMLAFANYVSDHNSPLL